MTAFYRYTGKNASQSKIKMITEILTQYHKASDRNIILGDLNFVENDLDRINHKRVGQNQTDKSLSGAWVEFLNNMDLSDPFRTKKPKQRMFSYIHTNDNSKSRLDRIYVNTENCNDILFYKQHAPQ